VLPIRRFADRRLPRCTLASPRNSSRLDVTRGRRSELSLTSQAESASNRDVVHVTEGWTTREAHAENFASDQARAFVARTVPLLGGEPQYQDEVPVGGTFRG
jgi:predicted phage gp36 major capsid-like protein